uniref:Uncharacterized protein n=1 Tax=Lutzomyia longipalpis TaxID=7200 RepID=A0A1B0CFJ7_LUTLO
MIPVLIAVAAAILPTLLADQVVLLDTTKEATLEWTRYPYGPQSQTPGNSDVDINTEVKSIAVTKKGVYFAFRDQGACISILAVKVYYITCPAVTVNFAHFNETPTGREVTIIEQQTGICVANAEAAEPPTYLCKGDGKWTILSGGCRCKVGYEPDFERQICNVCPAGTFRSAEVAKCTPCPPNSRTPALGSAFCPCLPGFYRHQRDAKHMPCYRPPGPPTNLTLLFLDQTSAIFAWNAPQRAPDSASVAYRSDVIFKVKCPICNSNVVFTPSTETFNDTKLTLNNLEPVTTYTIQIHSLNGQAIPLAVNDDDDNTTSTEFMKRVAISALLADESQQVTDFAEITFTTESATLSTIFNVRVTSISSKDVELMWDKPTSSETNGAQIPIEFYEVRCKTVNGWGTFSNIVYAQTHQSVSPVYDDSVQVRIIAGVGVAVVFILVLLIVATVLFLRSKGHDDLDKKTNNHLPLQLDYASNEVNTMDTTPIVKTVQNNESIKMSRYSQHFKEANLIAAQQISRLTAQQLSDMGITLVGHQKKILHQARQLDTII